jgi:hypothetical protein
MPPDIMAIGPAPPLMSLPMAELQKQFMHAAFWSGVGQILVNMLAGAAGAAGAGTPAGAAGAPGMAGWACVSAVSARLAVTARQKILIDLMQSVPFSNRAAERRRRAC